MLKKLFPFCFFSLVFVATLTFVLGSAGRNFLSVASKNDSQLAESPVLAAPVAAAPIDQPLPVSKKTVGIVAEIAGHRLGLQLADANTYYFTLADTIDTEAIKVNQKIKLTYQGDLADQNLIASDFQILN